MKKILTIEEGETDCRICLFEKFCGTYLVDVLRAFGINCQAHNLRTLKIEEPVKKTAEELKLDFIIEKINILEKEIFDIKENLKSVENKANSNSAYFKPIKYKSNV